MKTKILSLFILSLFAGNVSAQVSPFNTDLTMGVGPDVRAIPFITAQTLKQIEMADEMSGYAGPDWRPITYKKVFTTSLDFNPNEVDKFKKELEAINDSYESLRLKFRDLNLSIPETSTDEVKEVQVIIEEGVLKIDDAQRPFSKTKLINKFNEAEAIPEPLFKILNDSLEDHKPIFQNLD